jgi:MFS family permease
MIINYLVFALGLYATLYISVGILGICYGVHFSVMVSTSSELFGLKQFGKIYNFILLANPLGALVFSSLAGYIYDLEAAKQHSAGAVGASENVTVCYGPSCFRLTFCVLSGMACLGTLLGVVLTVRIRPVYQKLYGGSQPRISGH